MQTPKYSFRAASQEEQKDKIDDLNCAQDIPAVLARREVANQPPV